MATPTTTLRPPPTPPAPPAYPAPPVADPSVVQLGQLVTVLGQDPKYRGRILELLHEAAPNVPIPELDLAKAADTKVAAATQPLTEANQKLTERVSNLERGLEQRAWMEANGLDEEEMGAVAAFAKEHAIGKPDSALDYYRKAQLGKPRNSVAGDQITAESRKKLYAQPKQWFEERASQILAESRRRRGA